MLDPNFPAQINPVISGPRDLTTACETNEGNQDSAPNEANDGCDCFVNTIPARNDVNAIRNNDLFPTAKHWRSISLNSYGGENALIKNLLINLLTAATLINTFAIIMVSTFSLPIENLCQFQMGSTRVVTNL
jgi:hypothetical protein